MQRASGKSERRKGRPAFEAGSGSNEATLTRSQAEASQNKEGNALLQASSELALTYELTCKAYFIRL
jgi:hypothetical protein